MVNETLTVKYILINENITAKKLNKVPVVPPIKSPKLLQSI
jgi:hypothetical protein